MTTPMSMLLGLDRLGIVEAAVRAILVPVFLHFKMGAEQFE